jgi:hypothetical protein
VQSEEIKDLQIGKEDIKLPLFVNDIISFIKNPNNSAKILLKLMSSATSQDTRQTYRNLFYFYILAVNMAKILRLKLRYHLQPLKK